MRRVHSCSGVCNKAAVYLVFIVDNQWTGCKKMSKQMKIIVGLECELIPICEPISSPYFLNYLNLKEKGPNANIKLTGGSGNAFAKLQMTHFCNILLTKLNKTIRPAEKNLTDPNFLILIALDCLYFLF